MKPKPRKDSWDFLETFHAPQKSKTLEWGAVKILERAAPLEKSKQQYRTLKSRWDSRLASLGGDPSSLQMEKFRPLRLKREEDWSDWLAWLLENSTTGELAQGMFKPYIRDSTISFKLPKVNREIHSEDKERRADILIIPRGDLNALHVEVKVGDQNFEKTYVTGSKFRTQKSAHNWHDFILLPHESFQAWSAVANYSVREHRVNAILWDDLAKALRRCLWKMREKPFWCAWAWTFCGAIEQRFLGLPALTQGGSRAGQFQMVSRWLDHLQIEL